MAGIEGNLKYDFIELYNPTPDTIDLTGWYIKKKNAGGNIDPLVVSNRLQGKMIYPSKYFLIANEINYTGIVTPDATWASSYNIAYDNNGIIIYNNNDEIIDQIIWVNIPKNQSFERQSWSSDQFAIQPNPNPQNSNS
ncbi:lamin tail domain-containing protein [archaeon]|nr:MAG: lamin tail domain-containing protein [archaeon]